MRIVGVIAIIDVDDQCSNQPILTSMSTSTFL